MASFNRNIINELERWKDSPGRKPLFLRGARQVGKTVAIREFAKRSFKKFVEVNLEHEQNKELFLDIGAVDATLGAIELRFNTKIVPGETLLFLDEVQDSAAAMQQIRYLYEQKPSLHVIAAGSFLELVLREEQISFPVGRVENRWMYPLGFDEYLMALGNSVAHDQVQGYRLPDLISQPSHEVLLKLFYQYICVGGMPEAVSRFLERRSFDPDLLSIYENLQRGFQDDVYKYAAQGRAVHLRHVIRFAPYHAGKTVTYEGFAGSSFRSREIGEAFSILEGAMLLTRVFPSSAIRPPIEPSLRRRPKLLYLDTGLVVHALEAREALLLQQPLNELFQGRIAEQFVGQAILSSLATVDIDLAFWQRDKTGSTAEVDYLISVDGKLVPVEVKSGSSGKLRSLHQFFDESDSNLGVCINSFPPRIETIATRGGKSARIVFLPFYLAHRIRELISAL